MIRFSNCISLHILLDFSKIRSEQLCLGVSIVVYFLCHESYRHLYFYTFHQEKFLKERFDYV